AFVSAPRLRIAPRQRHVERSELVDLEALADGFDLAERVEDLPHAIGGEREDLEIDVGGVASHQAIADPAADDERAAACRVDRLRDGGRAFERRHRTGWRPKRFTIRSVYPGAIAFSHTSARVFRIG